MLQAITYRELNTVVKALGITDVDQKSCIREMFFGPRDADSQVWPDPQPLVNGLLSEDPTIRSSGKSIYIRTATIAVERGHAKAKIIVDGANLIAEALGGSTKLEAFAKSLAIYCN
jgi:hypothetical protein